jgi:hypothetical protein
LARLGAESLSVRLKGDKPVDFARMLAKIAYAMAVAVGALDQIEGESPVVPAIIGKKDDIGRWVGTLTEPIKQHGGNLHRVLIHRDDVRGLLIGDVHIFSDSHTPRYGVILGTLKS